jgi:hypothetical protein
LIRALPDALAARRADTGLRNEVISVKFEYKFVRIGENRLSAFFGVQDKARKTYEAVVHEQARDGWRLVQIFAPGVAAFGAAKYYELIFEREQPAVAESVKRVPIRDAEMALHAN